MSSTGRTSEKILSPDSTQFSIAKALVKVPFLGTFAPQSSEWQKFLLLPAKTMPPFLLSLIPTSLL